MEKVEEYKRKLEKYEKKAREEAKLFSIREFLREEIREKYVEGLGLVRFGHLTVEDLIKLNSEEFRDDFERGLMAVALMLRKADPEVTFERVKNLPIGVAVKLLNALGEEINRELVFLRTSRGSVGGLDAARSPQRSEQSATGSS